MDDNTLLLQAFEHAIEQMDGTARAEGLEFAKQCFGEAIGKDSPAVYFATGFLLGVNTGLDIADACNTLEKEKAAAQTYHSTDSHQKG